MVYQKKWKPVIPRREIPVIISDEEIRMYAEQAQRINRVAKLIVTEQDDGDDSYGPHKMIVASSRRKRTIGRRRSKRSRRKHSRRRQSKRRSRRVSASKPKSRSHRRKQSSTKKRRSKSKRRSKTKL